MKRAALLAIALPSMACAHTGDHGHMGLIHFLTAPDHLAVIGVGVFVVLFALFKPRSSR